jgi:hypothetical protein
MRPLSSSRLLRRTELGLSYAQMGLPGVIGSLIEPAIGILGDNVYPLIGFPIRSSR